MTVISGSDTKGTAFQSMIMAATLKRRRVLSCLMIALIRTKQHPSSSSGSSHSHHFEHFATIVKFICVITCHRPVGLLSSKGGNETFNVRNDYSAWCTHEGQPGTVVILHKSWLERTKKKKKMSFTLLPPGAEPRTPDLVQRVSQSATSSQILKYSSIP